MKISFAFVVLAVVVTAFSCGGEKARPLPLTPIPAVTPTPQPPIYPKDGNYNAKGRVTKIDMEIGSVELNHDDIPGVMPPMTMEFYVRDKNQLKPLKVGDQVDFVLEYKHPRETIVDIKKAN